MNRKTLDERSKIFIKNLEPTSDKNKFLSDEQIKLLNKRITTNYDIIKKYERMKISLNDKGLVDNELINIIDNKIKKCNENIVKDEDLKNNFIYELLK